VVDDGTGQANVLADGGRKGRREGGREGGRETGKEGGRKKSRGGDREGDREGGREGEMTCFHVRAASSILLVRCARQICFLAKSLLLPPPLFPSLPRSPSPSSSELAVQLLRVEPVRRQRLERELRKRVAMASRGIGGGGGGGGMGRETIGEWLWAELFRDPSERGRRLRYV